MDDATIFATIKKHLCRRKFKNNKKTYPILTEQAFIAINSNKVNRPSIIKLHTYIKA